MPLTRLSRNADHAAALIRRALTPPDAQRQSGPVRRLDPSTGRLLEVVTVSDWHTRYPHRFVTPRRLTRVQATTPGVPTSPQTAPKSSVGGQSEARTASQPRNRVSPGRPGAR